MLFLITFQLKTCICRVGKALDKGSLPLPFVFPNPRLLYDQYCASGEVYRRYLLVALIDVLVGT